MRLLLLACWLFAGILSAQNSPCDDPETFLKLLGSPLRSEKVYSICPSSDGNIYLAGRQNANPMIAKLTPGGQVLWVRNFTPANSSEDVVIAEIIEDSEGKIVICGTEGTNPASRRSFVMRYDPAAQAVLWLERFVAKRPKASGIWQIAPGENLILRTNSTRLVGTEWKEEAQLWEIGLQSGGVLPTAASATQSYEGIPNIRFESAVEHEGNLLSVGEWRTDDFPQSLMASLTTEGGHVEWARVINPDTIDNAPLMFTGIDVAKDGNQLIVLSGVPQDRPEQGGYVYLQKHHADGSLLWLKRYDILMAPQDVIVLEDAYVMSGWLPGENSWGIIKTDKDGQVLKAKKLGMGTTATDTVFYTGSQSRLIRNGNHLLLADHERNDDGDIVLLSMDFNLNLKLSCALVEELSVAEFTMPSKAEEFFLPDVILPVTVTQGFAIPLTDSLAVNTLCPKCSCADLPDLTFRIDSVYCSNVDGRAAAITICNFGEVLSDSYYVTFYDSNPFTGPAQVIRSILLPYNASVGTCITATLILDTSFLHYSNSTIYTLMGMDGSVPTPLDLAAFPFPGGQAECNYENNLDSFYLQFPLEAPDLGPDIAICAGESITLDPGSGYNTYQWSNGAATQSITVNESGEYIVSVTHTCGWILSDTVRITVHPEYAQTNVISLFHGQSTLIDGTAYTAPDTVIQTLTAITGCDSIVTNILELQGAIVIIECPANMTVNLPAGSSTVAVNYPDPVATSNCPEPFIEFVLLQGPASGAQFSPGVTEVCHLAISPCDVQVYCCFTVTVDNTPVETACDEKVNGCIRYELLDIRLDAQGQRTYRVRLTNTCATPLQFAYIQLPDGVTGVTPAEGSTYQAPGGNTYLVRNPNASPFYSIRFKPLNGSLSNGASDIFEYKLPQQAVPAFIHVATKLANGVYSEAHMNTYNCPVQANSSSRNATENATQTTPAVWPNPNSGRLFVDLMPWQGQALQLRVLNAHGQLVLEQNTFADSEETALELPQGMANGLYFLVVQAEGSAVTAVRFVLQR